MDTTYKRVIDTGIVSPDTVILDGSGPSGGDDLMSTVVDVATSVMASLSLAI